jgi:hypothetical protein
VLQVRRRSWLRTTPCFARLLTGFGWNEAGQYARARRKKRHSSLMPCHACKVPPQSNPPSAARAISTPRPTWPRALRPSCGSCWSASRAFQRCGRGGGVLLELLLGGWPSPAPAHRCTSRRPHSARKNHPSPRRSLPAAWRSSQRQSWTSPSGSGSWRRGGQRRGRKWWIWRLLLARHGCALWLTGRILQVGQRVQATRHNAWQQRKTRRWWNEIYRGTLRFDRQVGGFDRGRPAVWEPDVGGGAAHDAHDTHTPVCQTRQTRPRTFEPPPTSGGGGGGPPPPHARRPRRLCAQRARARNHLSARLPRLHVVLLLLLLLWMFERGPAI